MVVTVYHLFSHGIRLYQFVVPFAISVVPGTLSCPGGIYIKYIGVGIIGVRFTTEMNSIPGIGSTGRVSIRLRIDWVSEKSLGTRHFQARTKKRL